MSGSTVVFKKSGKSAQKYARKRLESSDSTDESDGESAKKLARHGVKRKNPMIQSSSKSLRLHSSSSEDDGEKAEREIALNIDHFYQSDKNAERAGPSDMGATARNEQETDFAVDSQAQFERIQKELKKSKENEENSGKEEKIYKGMAFYGAKEKEDSAAGNAASGLVRKGPIRAPQFVRMSVRWDYAPDLCKDYKETGFCTFGDSCKFLHDRGDYKHGWEIDRDFEAGKTEQERAETFEISDEDEKEELPFKCFICREAFRNPVVTKCKHYFCEKCALEHCRKTLKCYVCEQNTSGVFNPAKDLIARFKAAKKSSDKGSDEETAESTGGDLIGDTEIEMLKEEEEAPQQSDDDDEGETEPVDDE